MGGGLVEISPYQRRLVESTKKLVLWLPALGALSLALLCICVLSGVVLMTAFDPSHALASTLRFETERPFGWFFRALHAYSGHASLVVLLLHGLEHLIRRADRDTPPGTWLVLWLSVPGVAYLMLGGRALPGDAEGRGVASVLAGILHQVPIGGAALAETLVGLEVDRTRVLLTHHASSATLLIAVITVIHVQRLWPSVQALGWALGISGLLAVLFRPQLVLDRAGDELRGPWFLAGMRWGLLHLPPWFAGLAVPAFFFLLVSALPLVSPKPARWMLACLVALVVFGVATTVVGLAL